LREIREGVSGLGIDLAAGNGTEETAETAVEGTGADIVCANGGGDEVPSVFGGEALEFALGVEVTEIGIAGLTGRFAAAAVGEGEGTQGRAVLGRFLGHRELQIRDSEFGGPREEKRRGVNIYAE